VSRGNGLERGEGREASLGRDVYFSDGYFAMVQLCSQAQQLNHINAMRPLSVIEVGLGNGFTSSFLKRAGYQVLTVDINENLSPDICCSITELPDRLSGREFDLVVCCEVLEHLPFEQFEQCIRVFSSVGGRLYLTLPNYRRAFGFGGFLRLPRIISLLSLYVPFPFSKKIADEHFWELGSSKENSVKRVRDLLSGYYSSVVVSRYSLNPYHVAFICE